jgi:hypothetical protein
MTSAKPHTNGTEAALIRAKRRWIAIKYRRPKKPSSMAALRCAELNRYAYDRYGLTLPDDDAGKDDAFVMAHHLALMSGDKVRRISAWLTARAPWMSADGMATLIDAVIAKPLRWRADTLAKRLNLKESDRARLRITTIGAVDVTKAEREAARNARKRKAKRKARADRGVKPRAEYLAQSFERDQAMADRGDKPAQMVLPQEEGPVNRPLSPRCTGAAPAYGCTSVGFLTICWRQTSANPLHRCGPSISCLLCWRQTCANRACRKEGLCRRKNPSAVQSGRALPASAEFVEQLR